MSIDNKSLAIVFGESFLLLGMQLLQNQTNSHSIGSANIGSRCQ